MRDTGHRFSQTSNSNSGTNSDQVIASLAALPNLKDLAPTALDAVMILRYCALCEGAGRDPLADLAAHFRSVAIAQAAIELVETIRRHWPEPYVANRPCCIAMTEHEGTLSAMMASAAKGRRAEFVQQIHGFIRQDRHDRLYDACSMLCAQLLSAPPRPR